MYAVYTQRGTGCDSARACGSGSQPVSNAFNASIAFSRLRGTSRRIKAIVEIIFFSVVVFNTLINKKP